MVINATTNLWVHLGLILLLTVVIISFMMTTENGREELLRLANMIRYHKMEAILLAPMLLICVVWGTTKPPHIITEEGIELKEVRQTPKKVFLKWETTDERIKPGAEFIIQNRIGGNWDTVGRTTEKSITIDAFTIDKTRFFRVITDITEQGEN